MTLVMIFLKSWQLLPQEVEVVGSTFTKDHQVNLLLRALPNSWSTFVTTQGGILDLTFTTLLSNILSKTLLFFPRRIQQNLTLFSLRTNF